MATLTELLLARELLLGQRPVPDRLEGHREDAYEHQRPHAEDDPLCGRRPYHEAGAHHDRRDGQGEKEVKR